jgi:hypothetical protein
VLASLDEVGLDLGYCCLRAAFTRRGVAAEVAPALMQTALSLVR